MHPVRLSRPYYNFAFAVDLGTISFTSSPVTWAIGYVRNPVVQYTTSSGTTEQRRPYWTTRHSDINSLVSMRILSIPKFTSYQQSKYQIDAFLADYPDALARAIAFDEKVTSDAAKISPEYVDLVSLVARQVMGAIDITGSNASDVKAFMKDIGYSQYVHPL